MTLRVKVVFAISLKAGAREEETARSAQQGQKQQCTVVEVDDGATVFTFLDTLRQTSPNLQQCLNSRNLPSLLLRYAMHGVDHYC